MTRLPLVPCLLVSTTLVLMTITVVCFQFQYVDAEEASRPGVHLQPPSSIQT